MNANGVVQDGSDTVDFAEDLIFSKHHPVVEEENPLI